MSTFADQTTEKSPRNLTRGFSLQLFRVRKSDIGNEDSSGAFASAWNRSRRRMKTVGDQVSAWRNARAPPSGEIGNTRGRWLPTMGGNTAAGGDCLEPREQSFSGAYKMLQVPCTCGVTCKSPRPSMTGSPVTQDRSLHIQQHILFLCS